MPCLAAETAARAARALHAAAAGRLPGADQPAVVDAGAARPDRADRARDAGRGHGGRSARAGSGRGTSPASTCGSASPSTASTTGAPIRSPPIQAARTAASASRRSWSRRGRCRPIWCARRGGGSIVRLGGVEGAFTLPDPLPAKLLFISAGSGITPIMSMLRSLDRARGDSPTSCMLHSARTAGDVIFGAQLRDIDRRNPGFRLHEQLTGESGRMAPGGPRSACARTGASARPSFPDPADMLDAMTAHWEQEPATGPPAHGALPAHHRASEDGQHGEGGDGPLLHQRRERASRTAPRRSSSAGEDAGADASLRLPDGHLPHLRRAPALGQGPRSAHRRGVTGRTARWSAPASTRPRAPSRSSSEPTRERNTMTTLIESPLDPPDPRADRAARPRVRRHPRRGLRRTSAIATASTSRA